MGELRLDGRPSSAGDRGEADRYVYRGIWLSATSAELQTDNKALRNNADHISLYNILFHFLGFHQII